MPRAIGWRGFPLVMLTNGTVIWFDRTSKQYEIHRLDGSLVRTLEPVGQPANPHDLQLLGNGDYLVGAYVKQSHVDTSAYGGSSDADGRQRRATGGEPRRPARLGLEEPGPHLAGRDRTPLAVGHQAPHPPAGYDIVHWNSIEPDGNSVIASFRHLDAVYKINKSTGTIVWKLGGTTTPEEPDREGRSPRLHPRRPTRRPPAPRRDPDRVRQSHQSGATGRRGRCASGSTSRPEPRRSCSRSPTPTSPPPTAAARPGACQRRLADRLGQATEPIGGYKPDGKRTFLLKFASNFSYRAEPAPKGAVSARDLRAGMRAMADAQLR